MTLSKQRCKHCGCTTGEAAADAAVLGLTQEFEAGIYTCCQVDRWADEQWRAWIEAEMAALAACAFAATRRAA